MHFNYSETNFTFPEKKERKKIGENGTGTSSGRNKFRYKVDE